MQPLVRLHGTSLAISNANGLSAKAENPYSFTSFFRYERTSWTSLVELASTSVYYFDLSETGHAANSNKAHGFSLQVLVPGVSPNSDVVFDVVVV